MISTKQIQAMLLDLENDRIERTISTTNTDKFGQAICAFANDLPNHKEPGYLFLGVFDDGTVQGLNVTDDLLKDLAAIRTDGNIQPQPSMVVEKASMPEGDIVVIEVQPTSRPSMLPLVSERHLTTSTSRFSSTAIFPRRFPMM